MVPVEVVMAVTEYCWLQQKDLVPVEYDGQESPCNSWGEAMVQWVEVKVSATSMSEDAIQPPARACARSAESDNLHGIEEATMWCIVKDLHGAVQTF